MEVEPQPRYPRPIAEILIAIAEKAKQEAISPADAFVMFVKWIRSKGLCGYDTANPFPKARAVYGTTAITSGAEARDPTLSMSVVIQRNSENAAIIIDEVIRHGLVEAQDVILSTDLPKVKSWKQSDYLIFWFFIIRGLPPEFAYGAAAELQPVAAASRMDDESGASREKNVGQAMKP